jgi:transposase
MSRYRMRPAPAQEQVLREHCAHARYVWNLCVEQESWWRRDRGPVPGFAARCRQLTEARAGNPWLAAGSVTVQQQAIRDHGKAMAAFFGRTRRRPSWRKAGRDEGFRVIAVRPGHIRVLSRRSADVLIPKTGWVRFRLSRPVPDGVKSFRVTLDRASRVEDLKIPNMTRSARTTADKPGRNVRQKAVLNRGIAASGWGRLEQKAPGRVEKVNPMYTSQRCSACGHVDAKSRESQSRFVCTACGYAANADVNAAINIAAGHAVTARGGSVLAGPVNREPQHDGLPVA